MKKRQAKAGITTARASIIAMTVLCCIFAEIVLVEVGGRYVGSNCRRKKLAIGKSTYKIPVIQFVGHKS